MAGIRRVDFAVGGQDGISGAPAEADGPDLAGAGDAFDGRDEGRDQRLRNRFAAPDQPGP